MSALRLQALNHSLYLSSRDIGIQLYPGRPNVQLVAETQSVGHYLGDRTRIGTYDTEAEVDRDLCKYSFEEVLRNSTSHRIAESRTCLRSSPSPHDYCPLQPPLSRHQWLNPHVTMRHLKIVVQATAISVTMTRSGVLLPQDPTRPRIMALDIHRHHRVPTHPIHCPPRFSENGKSLMEQRDPSPDRQPCTLTKRGYSQILSRLTPYSGLRTRRRLIHITPMRRYLRHSRVTTLRRPT